MMMKRSSLGHPHTQRLFGDFHFLHLIEMNNFINVLCIRIGCWNRMTTFCHGIFAQFHYTTVILITKHNKRVHCN